MYQRRHAFENYYFATPVNPVMESTPRSIAHTGVAMPNAEFGPLHRFSAKDGAKPMGGILPLVNSSIAQLLQTKTQQPYVKVNVPRSTATAAVSQLGLPASYVSNKRHSANLYISGIGSRGKSVPYPN